MIPQFSHYEEQPPALIRIHPDHRDLLAMQRMWRAVVDQMIEDILAGGLEAGRARGWFRNGRPPATPTQVYLGFEEVCDLAGLEAPGVLRTVNEILVYNGLETI